MKMAIKDWPSDERPQEKLLTKGASALSDAELLAICLRNGCKGKSAVDLARELLQQFNGLRHLLESSTQELTRVPGMGLTKSVQLQAVIELARRHFASSLDRTLELSSSEEVKLYLRAQLRHHGQEVFACLFLDQQHRLIAFEKLFYGSVNQASVYPREVVKRALHHNAAAVILAHNHPSGVAKPSSSDRELTRELSQTLSIVDVKVVDHLIVGDYEVASFAEYGWL
jgi:DNA repair protein RadC